MLRKRKLSVQTVKVFDAFPKIPDDYKTHSAVGGTFSLASCCIIIYLIYAETCYFLDSRLQFKFLTDDGFHEQLSLNIDVTIATPCSTISADIIDNADYHLMTSESLQKEDTWWDMTQDQRLHFEALKHMNSYFREEYHAIHEILWKSKQLTYASSEMPKRTYIPSYPEDACRIHGSFNTNKVAGVFHVIAGRSIALPKGHIHITDMFHSNFNYSHRIHRFSFGHPSPGIIHPLEGDEKITDDNMMLYQYFIEIVPTEINMLMQKSTTYQYSVKLHQRHTSHNTNPGMPGIFFKYDISALKVQVIEERDSVLQFLIKLCATVGCIFVTNGLLNSIVQSIWNILCCKFSRNNDVKNTEQITVKQKTNEITNPADLVNVALLQSVESVDILVKPK